MKLSHDQCLLNSVLNVLDIQCCLAFKRKLLSRVLLCEKVSFICFKLKGTNRLFENPTFMVIAFELLQINIRNKLVRTKIIVSKCSL